MCVIIAFPASRDRRYRDLGEDHNAHMVELRWNELERAFAARNAKKAKKD